MARTADPSVGVLHYTGFVGYDLVLQPPSLRKYSDPRGDSRNAPSG